MQHIIYGACPHDCPDTCAFLTTVEDGKAVSIRGSPEHPIPNFSAAWRRRWALNK
ncbi:MAG TPA: hypothetical protein ENG33_09135 [Chloroflexi bacterium]|nr:hypothetical protein [Chloroflexota bacterium]